MRILGIDPGYATIGFGLITAERAPSEHAYLRRHHHPGGLPLSGGCTRSAPIWRT